LQTAAGRDPRALGLELVNEMVARVNDFCVLMLDDFHLVGETPAIVTLLEVVLDNLPDHVRLVVAGRSVYGIPAPRLYVRDELSVLNVQQLRFRAHELQALVRQTRHTTLTEAQTEQLLTATDGWIAALLLATRTAEHGAWSAHTGAQEHLYTYLAEEVLEQQSPALRRLLLATAIVDEFDEPLCQHLLETDSVAGLLRELGERSLFVAQIESSEGFSYRYHQLFAEFLRTRLWATQAEWARALHRRAAEWFTRREDWERAVRHWLAIGERANAAALMDRAAPALYLAGRTQLLSQWVEALTSPTDILARAPRLALAHAKTLIDQGNFGAIPDRLLDLAEARLREAGDIDQLVSALVTRGMLRRFQNRIPEALELARAAQAVLGDTENYRGYQAKQLEGLCAFYLDQPQAAIALLQTAIAGFRRLGAAHDLGEALANLALIWWQQENLLEAQSCLVEALRIRRGLGHRIALASALNDVAYLYHQTGRYADAWELYEETLALARAAQAIRVLAVIQNGRGDFFCEFEAWDEALAAYTQAREINETLHQTASLGNTYHGLAELERRRGHFNEAQYWWREAARVRGEGPTAPRYQAGLGAIYLNMGQSDLAREALTQALRAWGSDTRFHQEHALTHLRLAQVEFTAGREPEALDQLAQALRLAARYGNDHGLLAQGRQARALLAHATAAWPHHAQLHSLLERVEQFQPGLAQFASAEPGRLQTQSLNLEVLAFGPGRVRRNGELLPNSAWTTVGSRALFFYMVERGQASKETIGLDFWPDFSPEKVNSNFHTTLWRLRRALGPEVVVFDADHYRLAPHVEVWYDVAEFEAHLQQAVSPALAPEEQAEQWRQAIALYQDDYLTDISFEWADQRRRELQRRYLEAIARLAEWEHGRKRYESAQALYEKLVSLDPYRDEAHAAIMDCLAQRGLIRAARAHFRAYEKRLRADLNIPPPAFLQELYDKLNHRK
jgi:LuxR family maltose regulon positive regulatory protein